MSKVAFEIELAREERDAALAGLRLLQHGLDKLAVRNVGHRSGLPVEVVLDDDILSVLSGGGQHTGLTASEIDAICDRLQGTDN